MTRRRRSGREPERISTFPNFFGKVIARSASQRTKPEKLAGLMAQLAAIARRLRQFYEAQAKERQITAGKEHGRGQKTLPEKVREVNRKERESANQAGKAAGVNGRSDRHCN